MNDVLISNNKLNELIESINDIDYTHLLGYPPEVVAIEIITMIKDVIREHSTEKGNIT